MVVLKKNGNEELKKFIDVHADSEKSFKDKKAIITRLHFNKPLLSWPKDKERLLSIINTYLSRVELEKLSATLDGVDAKNKKKKKEEPTEEKPSENTEDKSAENTVDKTDENTEVESADNTVEAQLVEEELEKIEYIADSEYVDLPNAIYNVDDCTSKVLGHVVRILNHRSNVLKKIRLMQAARIPVQDVNVEVEKVAVYNLVLAQYLPILNNQKSVDEVNLKKATEIFEYVCVEGYEEIPTQTNIENEIKKNKEEQDFDIVSALAYVGVGVDRDDFGYYSIKNANNGNGIKYYIGKQEKSFSLSKNSVRKFVDDFLNKPIEKRKFITPGQVFITYIGEAEKSLGINTRSAVELNEIFGTLSSAKSAKAYFKDVIKRFSRNATEWKDFQKLFRAEYYSNKESKDDIAAKIHIKQQAKRLVIGELFQDILNKDEILSQEQIDQVDYRIGDITRDFSLDIDIHGIDIKHQRVERIEDQSFRVVKSMHSSILEFKAFVQDIIDNYTVDYLRKEKIFLLAQDEQNEFIKKKKEFEDLIEKLSYDKAKDSSAKEAYYQQQVDELTQKIGNKEYREAKADLLKTKNKFRVLLLNTKIQKERVIAALNDAEDRAEKEDRYLTNQERFDIIKETLSAVPEYVFTFEKGKATSWTKHRIGEKATKREMPLSELDKIIEKTATRISDESHQKILEENKIREAVKKAQKEERVKSANAYINAYGSIVGNASGVGAYSSGVSIPTLATGLGGGGEYAKGPTFGSSAVGSIGGGNGNVMGSAIASGIGGGSAPTSNGNNNYGGNAASGMGGGNSASAGNGNAVNSSNANDYGSRNGGGNSSGMPNNAGAPYSAPAPVVQPAPIVASAPSMYPVGMMAGIMASTPAVDNTPKFRDDYQNFDYLGDSVEPCVLPYLVDYDGKGSTTYGNMLENYAIFDRYKFLLTTNNNALYTYIENKHNQVQTPEQIISDLHIRYVKNAMAKSGLSTIDSNLAKFDYKADLRKFLSQYVPQNLIEIVTSDYNELIASINFDLLKDAIDHKFNGDLENYIPENIKMDMQKAATMIASIAKAIMSDKMVRRTYDEYSSKMKQTYISSVISKIESGEIPTVKISSEEVYSRMLDYISFSIKGQNVIIESQDNKDSGLSTYPRSIFFRQKENADNCIRNNKILTFEQNEIITTRNEPTLAEQGNNITNLFGTLYKFNGMYNKLLLKLKPFNLAGGVKFMENLVDALNYKIDMKVTVLADEKVNTNTIVPLVKFASKEREKQKENQEDTFVYDDERWYIRKGFMVDKTKVQEFYLLLAFGMKYALDKDKKQLREDFYNNNLLSLTKINEKFKDLPEETISLITSVIRSVMMTKCERYIDYLEYVNKQFNSHFNKILYISNTILESNNFHIKGRDEKLETVEKLEIDFVNKSEDPLTPHPEIYAPAEDLVHYEGLYLYYALTELFNKMPGDERFICQEMETYFDDMKRRMRNNLLAMIRDHIYMNGYEEELSRYYELNVDKLVTLDDKPVEEEETIQEKVQKEKVNIKNIDVMFKGINEGFVKALKKETNAFILEEMKDVVTLLEYIGTLPGLDAEEKDLEIALPNNQTILCNIKGFIQQYIFRYIVDREHELGPFAYVVNELIQHEELGEYVRNLEKVAEILNEAELGINLFAKFSSITMSNDANVLKIGENISTVVEIVNRLKTPTDMQKALNRDIFYKEAVDAVHKSFEQYFNRKKLEKMN